MQCLQNVSKTSKGERLELPFILAHGQRINFHWNGICSPRFSLSFSLLVSWRDCLQRLQPSSGDQLQNGIGPDMILVVCLNWRLPHFWRMKSLDFWNFELQLSALQNGPLCHSETPCYWRTDRALGQRLLVPNVAFCIDDKPAPKCYQQASEKQAPPHQDTMAPFCTFLLALCFFFHAFRLLPVASCSFCKLLSNLAACNLFSDALPLPWAGVGGFSWKMNALVHLRRWDSDQQRGYLVGDTVAPHKASALAALWIRFWCSSEETISKLLHKLQMLPFLQQMLLFHFCFNSVPNLSCSFLFCLFHGFTSWGALLTADTSNSRAVGPIAPDQPWPAMTSYYQLVQNQRIRSN